MAELAHPAPPSIAVAAGKPGWRWSAADTVIAISAGLIVVVFAIFGFLCWQGYGSTIASAKVKAQDAADIVADDVLWSLGGGLAGLKIVAAASGDTLGDINQNDKAGLDAALKTLPAEASLAIYDDNGNAVPEGGSPALPSDIASTDYFAALASGQDWIIAPQQKNAATGAQTIVIAQRLGRTRFAGAAVIAIPGALLQRFWEPQKLGPDSNINVHREDGWMVGRYPRIDEPINAAKISAAWPQISGNPSGTYTSKSPLDGITRIIGFRHVPELGLVVFATISQDAALAGLWTAIATVLWLMVPIGLALLIGSLITASILRRSAKTQASLAAAVAHNEVLFREIHHRVKNNLQSVGSLLQMQPIPREIKRDMGQRIAAMSAVHEHIYRSNDFAKVRVRDYLQTLIENIRGGAGPNVQVVEQLEDLAVDKDVATPLGLILNEVVANAFKHAFPEGRDGVITVRLEKQMGKGALVVEDNGIGFDPAAPAKGIGRRLIAALTQQLGGESEFASDGSGSRFTLSFPLAE